MQHASHCQEGIQLSMLACIHASDLSSSSSGMHSELEGQHRFLRESVLRAAQCADASFCHCSQVWVTLNNCQISAHKELNLQRLKP